MQWGIDMHMSNKDKQQYKRKCSIITVGGFRPTQNPLASNFAQCPVAKPEEDWPYFDGKPLTYICQFNLTEAPYVPEVLKDIAVITFFIDLDNYLCLDQPKGTWCIRAYKSLDGLVAMVPPAGAIKHKGFECRWELAEEDYPVYDDPDFIEENTFSKEDLVDLSKEKLLEMIAITEKKMTTSEEEEKNYNLARTKVGGWASNIQHAPNWGSPGMEFCLQIDSEEKVHLNWVDSGMVYIGRDVVAEEWGIDIQFY